MVKCKPRAEVIEGVEAMGIIEALLVFAVASLNLAVVPGSIGTNQFMTDAEFGSRGLKEGREITL